MRHRPFARYVPLTAFLALLAAPAWVTTVAIAVALAITAVRVGRFVARGLRRRAPVSSDLITLGKDHRGRHVTVTERDLSAHALMLGASGSGKTTVLTTILEQQIRRGRPVIVIDMKGSPGFVAQLAHAATTAGRGFRLWTPEGPSQWNPLGHGNPTELKDKLISTERFTEPHYQRAAERYLQNVFQVLRHSQPDRPPTLAEVVASMDTRRLPAALRGVPKALADRVQDYLSELTPDQRSAIRGLQTRLALITESESGAFLSRQAGDSIDLQAALAGGDVVVFSLNSSRYPAFAAQLGTLAVQDLITATGSRLELIRQGHELPQATVAIDEFSAIGAAHVVALFARGREAGVSGLVVTQEMADLDRLGRGVRDQILGNTALKLILRQDVPESANLVAQIAGTEKVWEETRQIGGTIFRGFPAGGTRREAEQFIVHPNQIKSLRTGDAVLISKLRGERARTIKVTPPARPRSGVPPARPRPGVPPARRAPGSASERSGPELG
jgi:conjugal transfer pilus assembly protein TraD